MDRLWAPWRMTYINNLGDAGCGCFLCAASQDLDHDRERFVLWRGRRVFCIMNRFPYNNGHLLVCPYRHEGDLTNLDADERLEIMDAVAMMEGVLRRVANADGFNVGINLGRAGGAGLEEHVHVHIVPRWGGDTNFMPVIADTKVIPQALSDLYDKLRADIDRTGGQEAAK